LAALFFVTVLLSAGLLFVVQPMVGKMLLPLLGGVPAVWNTCLVFFQSALLIGYGYAHTVARLEGQRQVILHLALALLAFGALLLRARPDPAGFFSATEQPTPWLVLQLALAVGLPFVVLSATAPMLQHWFARTSDVRSRDPYFLYAGSNLGSLVALLSYPLLLEPHLSLGLQSRLWTGGYVGFVGLVAACGLYSSWVRKADPAPSATTPSTAAPMTTGVPRPPAPKAPPTAKPPTKTKASTAKESSDLGSLG